MSGTLNWNATKTSGKQDTILSFDFATETYGEQYAWPSLYPCILENGIAMFKIDSSKLVVYNSNDGRFEIRNNRCNYPRSLCWSYHISEEKTYKLKF